MAVDPQVLGRAVRDARERMGMTQEDLGKAAGYQTGAAVSISRLETGKAQPGLERMTSIARALGVSVEELERRAVHPDSDAQRQNERPKDRERRVMGEVEERKSKLDHATQAFKEAYAQTNEHFLIKFGTIVESIEGAPPILVRTISPVDAKGTNPETAAKAERPIELDSTVSGGVAAGIVAGLLRSGTFSRGAAGLSVAGVGGAAVGVLAESAISLLIASRKLLQERSRMLDRVEEQLAATEENATALISRLPKATELLMYIAVHAGHALDRWERELDSPGRAWNSIGADAVERFRDFVLIAQASFAIQNEFDALSSALRGNDLLRKTKDVDALLTIADEMVKSRV
jgi:transcriptional regulator with XRE-family HTH domain